MAALLMSIEAGANGFGLWWINSAVKVARNHGVHKNLAYGSLSHQTLNLYPSSASKTSPVLVFVHGGGWYKGKKEQYHFIADAMLRRGYTVVIPDYIKYPEGRFPAFVEDVALSIRWVKDHIANYGGDPDQIVLAGHSAGAHTGALLATDESYLADVGLSPDVIKAFVGLAGPYEFTPREPKYIDTFGQANFEKMKASRHVNGNEPPMLLLHSEGDRTVGTFNFTQLLNQLKQQSNRAHGILYKKPGHAGMVLKVHPWFAGRVDLGETMDVFFRQWTTGAKTEAQAKTNPENAH